MKGSHKTGSMRASSYICIPGAHYKFKNAFFWETLCIKMHDFCINAIPELVLIGSERCSYFEVVNVHNVYFHVITTTRKYELMVPEILSLTKTIKDDKKVV